MTAAVEDDPPGDRDYIAKENPESARLLMVRLVDAFRLLTIGGRDPPGRER